MPIAVFGAGRPWRGWLPADRLDQALPDDAARHTTTPPETPGLTVTGGQDDRLIVSNSTTGDEIWSTPDFLAYDDVWAVGDGAIFMAHRAAAPDSTGIGSLRAYELETGEIRWETESHVKSYPWWVADGRVFSIWTDLTALTTTAGDVLWTTDYGTQDFPGMRGVLANDDTVFVSFANGWGSGD